jgi:hypothetical protein
MRTGFGTFLTCRRVRPMGKRHASTWVGRSQSDDLTAQYAKQDAVAAPTTPAEFAAFVTAEQVKWKAVVAATGVKFE